MLFCAQEGNRTYQLDIYMAKTYGCLVDVPLFGTPSSAGRASRQPGPSAPAATIAGGPLSKPSKAAEASANGTAAGATTDAPSDPGSSAPAANGSAHLALSVAPATVAIQDSAGLPKTASPFGSSAAAAPVFGIAARRSAPLSTPRNGAAATPKRGREEAGDVARYLRHLSSCMPGC